MAVNSSLVNYGFGELPEKRDESRQNNAAYIVIIVLVIIFILIGVIWFDGKEELQSNRIYNHVFSLPIVFVSAFFTKCLMCSFVFFEEWPHIETRYNNSSATCFKHCFQVFRTTLFVGFCVLLIFIMGIFWMMSKDHHFSNHWSLNWPNIITSVGVTIITNYAFGFKSLSVVELSEIHESTNINVAQGLAWSYFTGYLKIILKDLKGTVEKDRDDDPNGISWKAELNQGNLQCMFYAIVPLNCEIPSKLGDCPIKHKGITFEGKLPTLYVDRAGVKDRPYVNSVYKIDNGKGESKLAICEYVTIIDTLFQMPLCTDIDPQKREEQCRLLVSTLRDLIKEDKDCRNKCKIVTFSGKEDGPLLRDVLLDNIRNVGVQLE
ncbi:stimulator of interferon genes protein-like isoform X1 [Antedon mediterranea]|uniref:stimulator of interferon genes protein-like isoform X1 n=1 Tax=Antedon mediterranea TaxID=105859 RepID=UPI003AF9FAE5